VTDWEERARRAGERYEDGASRLPSEPDERQRQLTRMGNAAWAAGLSLLMLGRVDESNAWLVRAADTYRESWDDAPPESWGRPIGAMKSRLIAGDWDGARDDARWALNEGAGQSDSSIGQYAATLASLLLEEGDDGFGGLHAAVLRDREDFPGAVQGALEAIADWDTAAYETAIRTLLADFEAREEFLEDVPVADTVLALQVLARHREIVVELESRLLPPDWG
jgi:hypothetical protein